MGYSLFCILGRVPSRRLPSRRSLFERTFSFTGPADLNLNVRRLLDSLVVVVRPSVLPFFFFVSSSYFLLTLRYLTLRYSFVRTSYVPYVRYVRYVRTVYVVRRYVR